MPEQVTQTLSEEAMTCIEQGRIDEALRLFRRITDTDRNNAEAWMMQGAIHRELGQHNQSATCLKHALELDPDDAEAHFCLAGVLFVQQEHAVAGRHAHRAIEIDPDYGEAWLLLGGIRAALNRHAEAESAYRRALDTLPDAPDPVIGLAQELRAQGRMEEATPLYRQVRDHCLEVTRTQPGEVSAHLVLAELYTIDGEYERAAAQLRTALSQAPDNVNVHIQLASILHYLGAGAEMLDISLAAVRLAPDVVPAQIKVAEALNLLGRPEEALVQVEKVLAITPHSSEAITLSASILEQLGRTQEGLDRLAPVLLGGNPKNVTVPLTYAALAQQAGETGRATDALVQFLATNTHLDKGHRIAVLFALGTLYDQAGDYDTAFDKFQQANDLKHGTLHVPFNASAYAVYVDAVIATYNHDFLAAHRGAGNTSELPVFIVGMPRSGTTLVEQSLSSHPDIHGAGELTEIRKRVDALPKRLGGTLPYPACVKNLGAEIISSTASGYLENLRSKSASALRIIDKMPANFLHLGLIQILFPNARVIHCQRDPIDTCLSCYFQNFTSVHSYAYRLEDLAEFYTHYRRLMAHWLTTLNIRLFELRYEDLVADQEAITRALVEFCGLRWDDTCLRFHENRRFAATASYNQVRQPLYSNSVNRWKNYEKHLVTLLDGLEAGHCLPRQPAS